VRPPRTATARRSSGSAVPAGARPYDLRHAALSLWLASGAPPAEIAARAGHSIHVLLSVYVHCVPGREHIASQAIEHALALPGPGTRPAAHRRAAGKPCGPPLAPEMPSLPTLAPSARRPAHSYTP
jgi:hypothetical protein